MSKKFASTTKRFSALAILAVLLIAGVLFAPVIHTEFTNWQDDDYLINNLAVRSFDLEHARDIFSQKINGLYTPLSTLSFALEYRLFGFNPAVYHTVNLILHLFCVLLIYFLSLRLNLTVRGASFAALIFAIHPVHVEVVAWVSARKELLATFLYLLGLVSYLRYLDSFRYDRFSQGEGKFFLFPLPTLLGTLAMLAHPMAITLPITLLLIDWLRGRKIRGEVILEKLPLVVLFILIGFYTFYNYFRWPGGLADEIVFMWAWKSVFYLWQFFCPLIFVPIYELPVFQHFSQPEFGLSLIVLLLMGYIFLRFRKERWFIFSVVFYLCTIILFLGTKENSRLPVVSDRWMYLASVGFCIFLGQSLDRVWRWSQKKKRLFVAYTATIIFTSFAGFLGWQTYRQIPVWKNSFNLWNHQTKYFPHQELGLYKFAMHLRELPAFQEAIVNYRRMLQLETEGLEVKQDHSTTETIAKVKFMTGLLANAASDDSFVEAHFELANLFRDLGQLPDAIVHYQKALLLKPDDQEILMTIGHLFQALGDPARAIQAYTQVLNYYPDDEDAFLRVIFAYNLAVKPSDKGNAYWEARQKAVDGFVALVNKGDPKATSYFNLGVLYSDMQDYSRAITAYQMALDINPRHVKSLYNLGNAFKESGQVQEALSFYERTTEIDPHHSEAYLNRGVILNELGKNTEAKEAFEKSIRADRNNAQAYFNLGYIEEVLGNKQDALAAYQKAISLDANNAEAAYNMGNVYASLGQNPQAVIAYQHAVKANPRHMNAWVNLSLVSFKLENFPNALSYLDEAIILGYDAPRDYRDYLEEFRGDLKK